MIPEINYLTICRVANGYELHLHHHHHGQCCSYNPDDTFVFSSVRDLNLKLIELFIPKLDQ